ncbi:hypothetical protein, partial [Bacillus cereus]|uniref:hypothetical protein n=1 Tax=Bacillus cereus TaxID=1396 RepID=UPI001E4ED0DA
MAAPSHPLSKEPAHDYACPHPVRARHGLLSRHEIQTLLLPMATLAVVLAPIFWINPNTMSYFGLG